MEPLSSASLHLPSFDFSLSNSSPPPPPSADFHQRAANNRFPTQPAFPPSAAAAASNHHHLAADPSPWPLPHYWESDHHFHSLPHPPRAAEEPQRAAGVTIASLEDGSIGLKLGKRTYYGESAAGGDDALIKKPASSNAGDAAAGSGVGNAAISTKLPASPAPASTTSVSPIAASCRNVKNGGSSSSAANVCSTTTVSSSAIATKKQKSSATATLPKCQVEGCKADLSASKDYHRRHKVCEAHSKASKVRVASLEQRFCQQCSRFHVLTEFDEGKRSCRRRLAGHNERRRKPQQEPISLLSPRFALFPDSRMNALLEHPCFLQHRRVLAQQEAIANYQMLDLNPYSAAAHCFSGGSGRSNSSSMMMDAGRALMVFSNDHHHHHHHHQQQQQQHNHALALSNNNNSAIAPCAGASSPSISIVSSSDLQPSSEMAISGRALSLLSSPPLVSQINPSAAAASSSSSSSSSASSSSAMALIEAATTTTPSSYQLFSAGIHPLPSPCHHQVSSSIAMDIEDCKSLAMSNSSAMFSMFPDNSFLNLHSGASSQQPVRPILDLMQVSNSTESHLHSQQQQQQQQAEIPYTDLQGLSIFGRKTIL